jgi:hypothetical protein
LRRQTRFKQIARRRKQRATALRNDTGPAVSGLNTIKCEERFFTG